MGNVLDCIKNIKTNQGEIDLILLVIFSKKAHQFDIPVKKYACSGKLQLNKKFCRVDKAFFGNNKGNLGMKG